MSPRIRLGLAILVVSLCAGTAGAVSTRHFTLDSASVLGAGKLEGTAVTSNGTVIPGVETRKLPLDDTEVARCLLRAKDGTVYVGTGNDGKVFQLKQETVSEFAATGELLVSALAMDNKGTLYAGTLPHGRIYAIDKQGKASIFSEPEGADHIWDLAYDAKKKVLFAATGPEGKVFALDGKGKADVYYDASAAHVMSLALAKDGTLFAGTSGDALLLRLKGAGQAEVLYDFEGNELTALAVKDGQLAVGANLFPGGPTAAIKKPKGSDKKNSKDKTNALPKRPKPGKGALWRVDQAGRAERLFESPDGHITAVQWGEQGQLFAATGKEGHIYKVDPDGNHALWIDVDERQVLDLDLGGKAPVFVTSDGAAIYRVVPGKAQKATWQSKVLDAQFHARWGGLDWRSEGKPKFQTRSGNTAKPDATWSDWSSAVASRGPIRSPAARFLQIRATLPVNSEATLYAVTAYYLPRNQRPIVREVDAAPKKARKSKSKGKKLPPRASSIYTLKWKVENPDKDELRYRVYYRPEKSSRWRPMLRETEVLSTTSYPWQTDAVADGWYRVRVEASDELDNPEAQALRHDLVSEPLLVDNRAPEIRGLRVEKGILKGTAKDALGPISRLEFNVDGHEWKPLFPTDELLDTASESFELDLKGAGKGPHIVAVRAHDARLNVGSAELEFNLK